MREIVDKLFKTPLSLFNNEKKKAYMLFTENGFAIFNDTLDIKKIAQCLLTTLFKKKNTTVPYCKVLKHKDGWP